MNTNTRGRLDTQLNGLLVVAAIACAFAFDLGALQAAAAGGGALASLPAPVTSPVAASAPASAPVWKRPAPASR